MRGNANKAFRVIIIGILGVLFLGCFSVCSAASEAKFTVVLTNNSNNFKNLKVIFFGARPRSECEQEVTMRPKSQWQHTWSMGVAGGGSDFVVYDLDTWEKLIKTTIQFSSGSHPRKYFTIAHGGRPGPENVGGGVRNPPTEPLPGGRPGISITKATASSEFSAKYSAERAIDNNPNTRWSASAWTTSGWLELIWSTPQTFNYVNFRVNTGSGRGVPKDFDIEYYSNQGWRTALSFTSNRRPNFSMSFPRRTSKRWRLTVNSVVNPEFALTVSEIILYLTSSVKDSGKGITNEEYQILRDFRSKYVKRVQKKPKLTVLDTPVLYYVERARDPIVVCGFTTDWEVESVYERIIKKRLGKTGVTFFNLPGGEFPLAVERSVVDAVVIWTEEYLAFCKKRVPEGKICRFVSDN